LSKSRFILKQAEVSGGASSDLTRYIAKHDLDRHREGERARPLFTDRADDLTFWKAREWLSITGGALSKDDVLHYVLSFENLPDYHDLGKDDRERATEIRHALRRALSRAAKEVGVEHWRWAAGIHINQPNPHVHILFNKNAIDRKTGDLTRVTKLLEPLVAHYPKGTAEARDFNYGIIINSFAESVDASLRARAQERDLSIVKTREATRLRERSTLQSDRILLGESMLARHEMERLSSLSFSHEKREWKSPEHLSRLKSNLEAAREYHTSLQPHVENLRARYKESGAPLPLPLLSPAEIRKLQDAAIERRDAERIQVLEKIRLSLATERGNAPRDSHERGRLAAQLREAETDAQWREWREKEFDKSFHLIRFGTNGEPSSLAGIDARIERERVKTSFIHVGIAAYFPSERRAALDEIARLETLRRQVEERIHARQVELNNERAQATDTAKTLREISEPDARKQAKDSRENMPDPAAPIFTRAELSRMEWRAHRMHDADLLREVEVARAESWKRLAPEKREPREALAARAFAHELVAEFDLEEVRKAHAAQAKRSSFTPVAARLSDGSIVTGSVRQTEILSRAKAIIHIVENTPERRERFNQIASAASARDLHAQADVEATARYFSAAQSIAEGFRQEFRREGKTLPAPAFTKSELDRLDLNRTREYGHEPSRAAHSNTAREQKSQTFQAHVHTR